MSAFQFEIEAGQTLPPWASSARIIETAQRQLSLSGPTSINRTYVLLVRVWSISRGVVDRHLIRVVATPKV